MSWFTLAYVASVVLLCCTFFNKELLEEFVESGLGEKIEVIICAFVPIINILFFLINCVNIYINVYKDQQASKEKHKVLLQDYEEL